MRLLSLHHTFGHHADGHFEAITEALQAAGLAVIQQGLPVIVCFAQLYLSPDDLKHGGMSLKGCEASIRTFASKNGSCCTGPEAEKIIRKYFGLPEQTAAPKPEPAAPPAPAGNIVNLEDFFG